MGKKSKDPWPNEDGVTRRQLGQMAGVAIRSGALAMYVDSGRKADVYLEYPDDTTNTGKKRKT